MGSRWNASDLGYLTRFVAELLLEFRGQGFGHSILSPQPCVPKGGILTNGERPLSISD